MRSKGIVIWPSVVFDLTADTDAAAEWFLGQLEELATFLEEKEAARVTAMQEAQVREDSGGVDLPDHEPADVGVQAAREGGAGEGDDGSAGPQPCPTCGYTAVYFVGRHGYTSSQVLEAGPRPSMRCAGCHRELA